MKFAFCGDDFFKNVLEALMARHELLCLFSWPADNREFFNRDVIQLARAHRKRTVISPISTDDAEWLGRAGCDFLISAAYSFKVPDLSQHLRYSMNIHPSLLPVGRGPWPAPWYFLKGLPQAGVTIHQHSPNWDEGDVIAQCAYDLTEDDNVHSVSVRSKLIAERLALEVTADLESAFQNKKPQGPGEYWNLPSTRDRAIDFHSPTRRIRDQLRAFGRFGVSVNLSGRSHTVRQAIAWQEVHSFAPGTVVAALQEETLVATGEGFILIQDAQPQS